MKKVVILGDSIVEWNKKLSYTNKKPHNHYLLNPKK